LLLLQTILHCSSCGIVYVNLNLRVLTSTERASFAGTRIILRQVSPESENIFDFIIALHKACGGDWKALGAKTGVTGPGLECFLEYAAMFLGNLGNYKHYGDSKFVPRTDEKVFAALATASPESQKHYTATGGAIFSTDKQGLLHLGFLDDGNLTTYYPESLTITKEEISAVSKWMAERGLLPENTRLRKSEAGVFELLIASATIDIPAEGGDAGENTEFSIGEGILNGKTIKLIFGDHALEMAAAASYIQKADENSENEIQEKMHAAYAKSFQSGSLLAFKESQRFWVRDLEPTIESNVGFIETYRDPAGVRGEWEGFVAVVNGATFLPI